MPVNLSLKLNSYSAAFAQDAGAEVARILRDMADRITEGAEGPFYLIDVSGNTVGSAFLEVWPDSEMEEG